MRFPFYKMNLSAFSCCGVLKRTSHNAASLTAADAVNIFFPLPYYGNKSGFADHFMTFYFVCGSKIVQV